MNPVISGIHIFLPARNNMKKGIIASILLVILVFSAIIFFQKPADTIGTQQGATTNKDATYAIEHMSIILRNGVSETMRVPGSASKTVTRYFGNEAAGDVNGDGKEDIAFLLTQSGEGSGTFYYAVVALKTDNGYIGTNGVLLGDRIAPQTTEIRNGSIIVNYADRAKNEPMTSKPSVGISKYLTIHEGILVESPIR